MNAVIDTTPRAETRLIAAGEAKRINQCFDTLEADKAAALRGAYLDGHLLSRPCRAVQRAAEHHAHMAAPQPAEAEGVHGAMTSTRL